jgi:diadenosine tetraphosphate (Ap4A) HIT family hydrolase
VSSSRPTFCSDRPPGLCDASGLCEAVEFAALNPESCKRCYAHTRWAVGLVDISPIVAGHLLVTPHDHVTSTSILEHAIADEVWNFASDLLLRTATSLEITAGILLEHGVAAEFPGPACVRHAHVHVCPIGEQFGSMHALRAVLESLATELRLYPSLSKALYAARTMDSYLLATMPGSGYLLGVPSRSVPQVTRVALGAMNGTDLDTVDWALNPAGPLYLETMRDLGLEDPKTPAIHASGRQRVIEYNQRRAHEVYK